MECYGEKMLPNGIPELIYQVVPYDIIRNLKIIAHNKKKERGVRAQVDCDDCIINLYPTVIMAGSRREVDIIEGVLSFNYWIEFLRVILHEIGHIATSEKIADISTEEYKLRGEKYFYVERLADDWAASKIDKIKKRDNRVGQPKGWIGGLPGVYIIRFKGAVCYIFFINQGIFGYVFRTPRFN